VGDLIIPIAGLVAGVGVAVLLTLSTVPLRVLGTVLLAVGGLVLVGVAQVSPGAVLEQPLFLALLAVGGVVALAAGTLIAMRLPWLVPVAALVVGLRIPLRNPPAPIDHLAPLYLILAAGLLALVIRSVRGSAPPTRLGPVGWSLAAIVLVACASLFWTADRDATTYAVLAFVLPLGALAALTGTLLPEPPLTRVLPWLLTTAAAILAAVAIWQVANQELFWNEKLMRTNAYGGAFRANSLLFDPSLFGRIEALALVTIVGLLLFGRPRLLLVAAALSAVLIFTGLMLSYSQSSFVALAAGLVTLAAILWRWRALAVVAAIGVLLVAGALALPQGRAILDQPTDQLSSARLGLASRSLDLFSERPIGGSGLGAFATATGQRKAAPHNVVAGTAAELGVVGGVALAALLASVLWAMRNRRPDADRTTHVILTALFVTILVHAVFYDNFLADPAMWVIAALLATGAGRARLGGEPPTFTQATRFRS
jgi:O-antigen ligase